MKIFCIGRNYAAHAKEMKAELPEKPMFFMKPDTAILRPGEDFYYPDFTEELHFECELVVKIKKVGKNIAEKYAGNYYDEVSLGIDLTARDLQAVCKQNKHPWEIAKGFDNSAPIGQFINLKEKDIDNLAFHLKKNGETVQIGNTKNMLFSVNEIIAYLSKFITLKTGDLIFTGTPEGVGPLQIGDHLEGFLGEDKLIDLNIK